MKLLITGAYKWTKEQVECLKKYGWDVLYIEREDSNLDFRIDDIDAIVCNWFFIYHDIHEFKALKYIQLLSAGLDRVPLDYIKENNIILYNARGVYSIPMAEFVVSSVLQIYKQCLYFNKNQIERKWEKNRNLLELYGKRVCIIGAGSVGIEVGKRFSAFTDEVYGIDINPIITPHIKVVYPIEALDREIALSDVIILTLPLTKETRNLFSKERFKVVKKNAILINISRGGLVDETALEEALDNRLMAAVFDVFQEEPLHESSPLWMKKNMIITPHNSFVSEKNSERMWDIIIDNLSKVIK